MSRLKKLFVIGILALAGGLATRGVALAKCGDVSGDNNISTLDLTILREYLAEIRTALPDNGDKTGNVSRPGEAPPSDTNISTLDITIIRELLAELITGDLVCNEAITPGSTFAVPIAFTGNGAAAAYKAFQVTVAVSGTAGATLDTTQSTPGNPLSFHTCRMSATTGKVLCVDTAEKVASGSKSTLATINVKVPRNATAGSQITLAFSGGLAVATGGTTSTVSNLETSTATFTVSAAQ